MGCKEKHTPFGMLDEDTEQLHLIFGSSAKTSDFIVDGLYGWWEQLPHTEREAMSCLQIKADNGPQSNGRRTQFLKRMVELADHKGQAHSFAVLPAVSEPNTIRWSAAGASWKSTGMAQSWSM